MQAETVSFFAFRPSWTAGVAKSTSQVTMRMSAPPPIRSAAACFVFAGSSWVLMNFSSSLRPPRRPPAALIFLIWICAEARPGPSNGAMFFVRSSAQPILIGAAAFVVPPAVVTAKDATTATQATTVPSAAHFLSFRIRYPLPVGPGRPTLTQ
jgi:hypothetical protein